MSCSCAWVVWSLLLGLAVSNCNQILRFWWTLLGGATGTGLLPVCGRNLYNCFVSFSSLSLSVLSAAFSFWTSLQKLSSIYFWLVTSVGENKEKANTIQSPFLCFSHLYTLFTPNYFLYYLSPSLSCPHTPTPLHYHCITFTFNNKPIILFFFKIPLFFQTA